MTLKETIAADRAAIFLNQNEFAASAIWTPAGGVAQPEITVLFNGFPLHGDENQETGVEQPSIFAAASSADTASMKNRDTILINSTTYELKNDPYPLANDNAWSLLDLRHPRGQEPLI